MNVAVLVPEGTPEVLVERTRGWAEALGGAARVLAEGEPIDLPGPLVVVWADTPRLGRVHADGVRADLDAGTDVVAAPTLDGDVYLLAMREPAPELVGLRFARVLEQAAARGLSTGMMRHERRLRTAADVRALLADPLLPDAVRAAIEDRTETG